ncbi:ATP-binding cassette, subfamily B, bacterial [Spiroplasma chinense]|uniref:ATP-binding cassette, subfamily B, bacterial n=1 Tax=Spiroplasma chinense TaxID=216932 RepID=A0A5B9Y587_9MOLU|nr:ABC transporter ATP-binding protein [Spiroplasma chinense]QEH61417.1 ATP-binding cassette, subfamily B, bacterial [Spiroplasma chinense]
MGNKETVFNSSVKNKKDSFFKSIKKGLKSDLRNHLIQSLKDRWFLSTIIFLITLAVSLLLIANIKNIEMITQLLVSKSVVDVVSNEDSLDKLKELLVRNGIKQSDIDLAMSLIGDRLDDLDKDAFIQDMIKTFFYSNVNYNGKDLYITFWSMDLTLYKLIYIMIADIGGILLGSYVVFVISGWVAQAYESKIRKQLIEKLIDQDVHYFSENKIGELIGTLVKDSQVLSKHVKEAPVNYCLSFVTVAISCAMLFHINWQLALCIFALLGICVGLVLLFILITNQSTKNIHKLSQKLDNDLNEKVYSIRLIKSSGTFNQEKDAFNRQIYEVDKKNKAKLFLSEVSNGLIIGGIGSFAMASIIFGLFLFYNETQSLISIMTAFETGVVVMTLPIMQLRQVIADEPAARISARSVTSILNSIINIEKSSDLLFEEQVTSIKFNNITFKYPGDEKIILKDLNIKLEKNNKYAFVGPTGSGKSTIAKLILRFYDPSTGEIVINNNSKLNKIDLKSWLDKIGYVDQEPQILSGTIYDNIAYGLQDVSEEKVIDAAKKAKLHNLIMTWPDGYKTVLYERGAQLSGGQKQRLVIARLILKDPEILILDEATSALDNLVEAEIQAELEKLMVGRTTISIAHRLSTIRTFDKIFVIEPGVGIVQEGKFDELIKAEGLFKKLYETSN